MKSAILKLAIASVGIVFILSSCGSEGDKGSMNNPADTMHTENNARVKNADDMQQQSADSTNNQKDSTNNDGNADPSGRIQN